mmetsp:Transcript_10720/g.17896  ORF Transcript_10720/g.17896 Transcript_10720/m.17896 type:complete len:102 (-) Transcript_10720:21-326(-)
MYIPLRCYRFLSGNTAEKKPVMLTPQQPMGGMGMGMGMGGGVAARRTDFRLLITGLPIAAGWQDLKDFFRAAGDVTYTDTDRMGGGVVEFGNAHDMRAALE